MTDERGEHNIGKLLAFIRVRQPGCVLRGPILLITGGPSFLAAFSIGEECPFMSAAYDGPTDIGECDKEMQPPEGMSEGLVGLLIFEGWVQWDEIGEHGEPEASVDGFWRALDHAELVRVQQGLAPW